MSTSKEFSAFADLYLKSRPVYPLKLYQWIAKVAKNHEKLLDVGTGNGQAAIELARYFKQVFAIDASYAQLKLAIKKENINYIAMRAESLAFENKSIDVITAASSAHWFDLNKFYKECYRVLNSNGLIILWTYTFPESLDKQLQYALQKIKALLFPCWGKESLYHINQYTELPFSFKEISAPDFSFVNMWSIEKFISFIMSWPSIRQYINEGKMTLLEEILTVLQQAYEKNETKEYNFPIYLKAGHL